MRSNVKLHRIAAAVMETVQAGFCAGDVESAYTSLDLVVGRIVEEGRRAAGGGGSTARPEENAAVRHRR